MKLALYDFDGTYVNIQTLPELFRLWKRLGIEPRAHRRLWRRIMIRYVWYRLHWFGWSKRRFHPYAMEQAAELFLSVEPDVVERFLKEHHRNLLPHVNPVVKERLRLDRLAGYRTVLLSGNLENILKPFEQDGFDDVIGTPVEREGKRLGATDVTILIDDGKVERIRAAYPDVDWQTSKAYADSGYDLPLLQLVGEPIAVHPDADLRRHAEAQGWEILENA